MVLYKITTLLRVALLCSLLPISQVFADTSNSQKAVTQFRLELGEIQVVKESEVGGDEVYISVAEYSNYGKPQYHRIPSYPTYWLSRHLTSVKNVHLWHHDLKDGDAVQLIVSVIERDLPPWNVDDLIGAIKVNVNVKDGKTNVTWDHDQFEKEAEVLADDEDPKSPHFTLKGNNSEYKISFNTISERVSN